MERGPEFKTKFALIIHPTRVAGELDFDLEEGCVCAAIDELVAQSQQLA